MAKAKTDTPDPLTRSPFPPDEPNAQASGAAVPPPHAIPTLVDPAAGPLPRVVPELARAVAGTTRYKVRCKNMGEMGAEHLYVLAAAGDEDGAKACFLTASGVANYLAGLKRSGANPDAPVLAVVALAD